MIPTNSNTTPENVLNVQEAKCQFLDKGICKYFDKGQDYLRLPQKCQKCHKLVQQCQIDFCKLEIMKVLEKQFCQYCFSSHCTSVVQLPQFRKLQKEEEKHIADGIHDRKSKENWRNTAKIRPQSGPKFHTSPNS